MIQVTDPSITAISQNAPERTRSISEPDTIDAVVQENSRKAAQNTPLRRAHMAGEFASVSCGSTGLPAICGASSSLQGVANGAETRPPLMPGPFTIAE